RRHGGGGRVPRGVRQRTVDAGQLRVPRAPEPGGRGRDRRRLQVGRAHRTRRLGRSAMTAVETRLVTKRLHDRPEDSWTIDGAIASGAYASLKQALTMTPAAIGQEEVKASGLRGRGGAGFPAATKWSFLAPDSYPRYLVVNGDQGETSTFQDRMLVERDPHALVEGIAIAAFSVECHLAFVYLRGEFALGYERLTDAVRAAYEHGFLGKDIQG